MLKLGIAGFRHGHIFALYNIAMQSDRFSVVGAWEADEQAKKDAEQKGVCFNYDTYEDMLADPEIEAVALGNYYGARGPMAIAALKAGKHVIADKPICISLEELDEIERLAKAKGLSVGLMLDCRYNGNILAAKNLIDNGELGEIYNIQFGGQHPLMYGSRPGWYFEEGKHGGVINDIAIHGIDLIPYLTGLQVKSIVGARTWNAYAAQEPDFKDCGQLMLELSNGAGVIADISYSVPNSIGFDIPYYWDFRIWGSKGMISFNINGDGVLLYQDGKTEVQNIPAVTPRDTFLDAFADEIEGKDGVELCTEVVLTSSRITLLTQKKADSYVD